jgi:hypothetical protein
MPYVLLSRLRRIGLCTTDLVQAKLLKIGAQIRMTERKVWVSIAAVIRRKLCTGTSGKNLRYRSAKGQP